MVKNWIMENYKKYPWHIHPHPRINNYVVLYQELSVTEGTGGAPLPLPLPPPPPLFRSRKTFASSALCVPLEHYMHVLYMYTVKKLSILYIQLS